MLPCLVYENVVWDGFESLSLSTASHQAMKPVGLSGKEVKFVQHVCSLWAHVCPSVIFFQEFRSCLMIFSRIFLLIAHIWTFLWTTIQKKGNWTHFFAFSISSFSEFPLLVRGWMFPSSHVYQGTSSFSQAAKWIHSYPLLVNPHCSSGA